MFKAMDELINSSLPESSRPKNIDIIKGNLMEALDSNRTYQGCLQLL
jgi:hypothetical protein